MRLKILLNSMPKHLKEQIKVEQELYHMVPMILPKQQAAFESFLEQIKARKLPHKIRREGFIMKGQNLEVAIIELPMIAVDREQVYAIAKEAGYVS